MDIGAFDLLAVSTGVALAYIAVVLLLAIVPMIVTALKRHWLLFAAGWLVLGLVWWIASFRLARPNSWWARHFYGDDKLARARERYEPAAD